MTAMLGLFEFDFIVLPVLALLIAVIVLRPKKPVAEAKPQATVQEEVIDEEAEKTFTPMKIFFGSQTGTAEAYSKRLAQEAKTYKFKPQVIDLDAYDFSNFAEDDIVAFVCSTYGEGEPPDNAKEFWNYIHSDLPSDIFSKMRYFVFALGNKTYEQYNTCGRGIDSRLEQLGATRLVARGEGDDDGNLEEDFIAWKEKLWTELCAKVGMSSEKSGGDVPAMTFKMVIHDQDYLPKVNRERSQSHAMKMSVDAKILVNRELHTTKSDRSCRHIEIDCADSNLSYETGDHLAVFPNNHHELVAEYAKRLNADLDTLFTMEPVEADSNDKSPFPSPCTVRDALTKYCDITSPASKMMLQVLAHYATDAKEKDYLKLLAGSSEESKAEYNKYIKKGIRNVLEVLEEHPSVQVPIEHILQVFPSLQCRYYSISSSNNLHPEALHITAVLVEYKAPTNRYKFGVCTKWLSELRPNGSSVLPVTVKCLVRKSNFRLPVDKSLPVVMVGPGTGLAPFRGFIQERHYQRRQYGSENVGPTVLFFGCRNREIDFLYEDELLAYTRDGTLSALHVAFSRESTEKKEYVQHKMVQEKESVFDLIYNKKGYFYICGEAQHMAKDVRTALINMIGEYAKLDEEGAKKYVDVMQQEGRLQLDVWS
eukprot:TRINITY_DN2034_c0_g1_i1.p1 TRINITY_DN2034_c0_g1~~TRINITY_DN2034_c0_g1_i1.p1  ORF type:complete len:650 (+),score=150.17 TRINITY_DN2034_c0_g1_i1:45-1994(+)